MELALRGGCLYCRVEVIETSIRGVAKGSKARARPGYHRTATALAVCHLAPLEVGGPRRHYHLIFPELVAVSWAVAAAKCATV
jgi:hypothetical protein